MNNIIKRQISAGQHSLRKSPIVKDIIRDRYLYLFLLPGVIWFIIFKYLPMGGLIMAFKEFSFSKGILGGEWVGLKYFKFIFFESRDFFRILKNTLLINMYELVFSFPIPIILAIMLNELQSLKLKKIIQTSIYFPHFVSWVVFGGIIIQLLSPSAGIINEVIKLFIGNPIYFMTEEKYFRSIVVLSSIWKGAGWGTIIYIAAISGIDQSLYDAALIDGATKMQTAVYITIPSISQTIVFLLIMNIGKMVEIGFDQIYVLLNPTVYSVGDVISTYVYRVGIGGARFSLTTAIGLFQSVVGFTMIIISNYICRKLTGKSIW